MRVADLARAALIGAGATAVMDLGGEVIRRTTGARPLDYALLGRWVGHLGRGRVRHENIRDTEPIAGERPLGWVSHFSIGVGFGVLLAAARPKWLDAPTLAPALVTGVVTTAAPWLVMQPAFGMGVAGRRTPDPRTVRLRSLRTHATYGIGLWAAGKVLRAVVRRR